VLERVSRVSNKTGIGGLRRWSKDCCYNTALSFCMYVTSTVFRLGKGNMVEECELGLNATAICCCVCGSVFEGRGRIGAMG